MVRPRARQRGLGLVELLLAVLIGSIGMLGLVASQLVAGRSLEDARFQGQAALLAADMHARLRTNPQQRELYLVQGLGAGGVDPGAGRDCRQVVCDPAELARFDLRQWHRHMDGDGDGDLPGAVDWVAAAPGMRACLEASGRQVSVRLAWSGRTALGATTDASDCAPALATSEPVYQRALRLSSWGTGP